MSTKFKMALKALIVTTVALLASFSMTKAATLTTGALALDGSNIDSFGNVVYAYNFDYGAVTTTPVQGGVTFVGAPVSVLNNPQPNYTVNSNGSGYDGTGGGVSPTDAVYALNQNGIYYQTTLTVNNLQVGKLYSLQLILDADSSDDRRATYTDGTASATTGASGAAGPVYITDVFFATSTSHTVTGSAVPGYAQVQLSGFVLEAPEPSTWALMVAGVASLFFFGARRRAISKS